MMSSAQLASLLSYLSQLIDLKSLRYGSSWLEVVSTANPICMYICDNTALQTNLIFLESQVLAKRLGEDFWLVCI